MSNKLTFLEIIQAALLEPEIGESTNLTQATLATLPKTTKAKVKKKPTGWKLAVVLPDAQIGFRRYEDGTLDPFHDVHAIDIAMQVLAMAEEEHGVDMVINLGDTIDLPMFGKYAQENSFYNTINETLTAGHSFLASQRALAPHSRVIFIEGNHDCRINKYMNFQAMAASRMKQVGSEDAVNSLQHLLRFEDLRVEMIDGYPADKFYINDRLIARHGTKANSNGATATRYLNANHLESVIYGHSHRQELMYKTHDTRKGMVQNVAYSPGSLCRVDGAVPSVAGGIKADERPVEQYENWQQGVGLLWYKEAGDFSGANDFTIENIHIMDGWAVYAGNEFRSTIK